jgi:RNase P subunit RPR2
MKILRNAIEHESQTKEVTCTSCTSLLEITGKDVTLSFDQRDRDYFSFTCPVCRKRNCVDASEMPKLWSQLGPG